MPRTSPPPFPPARGSAAASGSASFRGHREATPSRAARKREVAATKTAKIAAKIVVRALAVLLLMLPVAGCEAIRAQRPGTLEVRNARLAAVAGAATLELGLDCRLSGPALDALEHDIPITLQIDLAAGHWPRARAETRRVELRYFPLSRRYQMRELDGAETRSFATPAYLLAALGALRFDLPDAFAALPPATPLRVSARLDPAALPGPLRLPALFEPAWRLASPDYAWTLAAR